MPSLSDAHMRASLDVHSSGGLPGGALPIRLVGLAGENDSARPEAYHARYCEQVGPPYVPFDCLSGLLSHENVVPWMGWSTLIVLNVSLVT